MAELCATPEEVRLQEAEILPNHFAAKALIGVLIALFLACVLNQIGVFEVDGFTLWLCFLTSCCLCGIGIWLAFSKTFSSNRLTKYIVQTLAIITTCEVLVYFNINVYLLLILPMMLSLRYRSIHLTVFAIVGSALCCILFPIIAWQLDAWSLNILMGYIQTACGVEIVDFTTTALPADQVFLQLFMYLTLPQLLAIALYGFIMIVVTHMNIEGLEHRLESLELSQSLSQELQHVSSMQDNALLAIAELVESRDQDTGGHVKRTSKIVKLLAEDMRDEIGLEHESSYCDYVEKAAPLHDIGKIAVDDVILRKPGKLNADERRIMEQHSAKGARIIRSILRGIEDQDFIEIASNIALYHHERYDGKGYPFNLSGQNIPLEARIMAIADVYDALVSRRSYKEPISADDAFLIIESGRGTQFDPCLVDHFIAVRNEVEDIYYN